MSIQEQLDAVLKEKLEGYRQGSPGWVQGYCPFPHPGQSDKEGGSRSFSVHAEKGVWKCFSCKRSGNAALLVAQLQGIKYGEAKASLGILPPETRTVPMDYIRKASEALLRDDATLRFLLEKRGITKEWVLRFNLGYSADEGRLYIPIYDEWGRPVDVRRHLVDRSRHEPKSLPYRKDHAQPRLFLQDRIEESDWVVILEGELDAMLCSSLGFPAISVSGSGAGAWSYVFHQTLAGKRVFLCYDQDEPGRDAAKKIAEALYPVASEVSIVTLDLTAPKKDFTDWIIEDGHTREEFDVLMKSSPAYVPEKEKDVDETVHDVDLRTSAGADFYGKTIRFKAQVAGKDLAPFIYPKKLRAYCNMGRSDNVCGVCGLGKFNGSAEVDVSPYDEDVLKLINCDDDEQRAEVSKRMSIYKCSLWKTDISIAGNIEEMRLIPEIDYAVEDTEYCIRNAYFVGAGIRTNSTYEFCGTAGADPRTQHSVPILVEASSVQGNLTRKPTGPDRMALLNIFRVGSDGMANDRAQAGGYS